MQRVGLTGSDGTRTDGTRTDGIRARGQLHMLATCIVDMRANAAGVLLFVNTQLPYLAVQLFAVRGLGDLHMHTHKNGYANEQGN